jgi:integrase
VREGYSATWPRSCVRMDVDFAAPAMHVRENFADRRVTTTKSGKVRSLPLADQVAVALDGLSKREHFKQPGDLVVPNAYGRHLDDKEIRQAFYGALKRASLGHKREGPDPFVFHDARSAEASCWLARQDHPARAPATK